MRLDPERLILTTGTSEAYSFIFRLLCNPDDEILIAHPSYPLFDFLATIQDVKLCPFPLVYDHGWQIDFPALQKQSARKLAPFCWFTQIIDGGHLISANEAEELNRICLEHGLALVIDEVFLDYKMEVSGSRGTKRGSFVSNDGALTFVLSGLSKIAGLPQMKVGWIAANGPEELVRDAMARLEVIADTYLSLNAPVQQTALPVLLAQRAMVQPQIMSRVEEMYGNWMSCSQNRRRFLAWKLKEDGAWYYECRPCRRMRTLRFVCLQNIRFSPKPRTLLRLSGRRTPRCQPAGTRR